MWNGSRNGYQRWQVRLFQHGWFARTFVLTMGRFATPIYDWAYDLIADDLAGATDLCDLGCGNGLFSLRVAQSMSDKRFRLVDISSAQIRAGRRVIEQVARDNWVECCVAPAEELPLADHSVDVLFSGGSINLWYDPARGLAHCKRVVRPGGALWILDQRPCSTTSLALDALVRKRVFGLGIPGYRLEEVLAFAREAGLEGAEVHEDMSLFGIRWQL